MLLVNVANAAVFVLFQRIEVRQLLPLARVTGNLHSWLFAVLGDVEPDRIVFKTNRRAVRAFPGWQPRDRFEAPGTQKGKALAALAGFTIPFLGIPPACVDRNQHFAVVAIHCLERAIIGVVHTPPRNQGLFLSRRQVPLVDETLLASRSESFAIRREGQRQHPSRHALVEPWQQPQVLPRLHLRRVPIVRST